MKVFAKEKEEEKQRLDGGKTWRGRRTRWYYSMNDVKTLLSGINIAAA